MNSTGSNRHIDLVVTVTDELGNPATAATVNVTVRDSRNNWSGTLLNMGGGSYRICNVGSFSDPASNFSLNATATEPGYITGTRSGTAVQGNLC